MDISEVTAEKKVGIRPKKMMIGPCLQFQLSEEAFPDMAPEAIRSGKAGKSVAMVTLRKKRSCGMVDAMLGVVDCEA